MNLGSLLGALPASDSVKGKLNGLDFVKILRMALVVFSGAFLLSFGTALTTACNAESCDLSAIGMVTKSALEAAVMAGTSAAVEAVRRKFASAFQG